MLIERAAPSCTATTTPSSSSTNANASVHRRFRGRTTSHSTILLMKAGARLLCGVLLLCALHVSFTVFRQLEAIDASPAGGGGDAAAARSAALSEPPLPPAEVATPSTDCPLPPWHSIALQWADPTYAQNISEHRGGWKAVMQGLLDDGVVHLRRNNNNNDDNNNDMRTNVGPYHRNVSDPSSSSSTTTITTVVLIDMAEKWFVWDQKPAVLRPWIGITHLVLHPPPPFEGMDLMGLLDNPNFQQSLPHCVGIVVLHQDGVEPMERQLRALPPPPPPPPPPPSALPPPPHKHRPTHPGAGQAELSQPGEVGDGLGVGVAHAAAPAQVERFQLAQRAQRRQVAAAREVGCWWRAGRRGGRVGVWGGPVVCLGRQRRRLTGVRPGPWLCSGAAMRRP